MNHNSILAELQMFGEPSTDVEIFSSYTDDPLVKVVNGNFIHKTALIGPNVTLGNNNYIGPYCVIGYPAEHKMFWGETQKPNFGSVVIGNNNVFTGHVTVDAGTEQVTIISNGCWLLKNAYVAHDCIIENEVTLSSGVLLGGHSIIMSGANMGLGSICHQRSIVGSHSMVGMGCVITKKSRVAPFKTFVGNPARVLGPNKYKENLVPEQLQLKEKERYQQLKHSH